MKKLLFIFAIAAFAACNDSAESTTEGADTTVVAPIESSVDTSALKADTSAVVGDTTSKAADTLKK